MPSIMCVDRRLRSRTLRLERELWPCPTPPSPRTSLRCLDDQIPVTACECERTQSANLAQSLHLLNSKEVQAKLSDPNGRAAKWAQQSATPEGRTTQFANCTKSPSHESRVPEESEVATRYLQARTEKLPAAFEDLIWAMINSKEFLFQH